MTKCGFPGCTNKASGGFDQYTDASHSGGRAAVDSGFSLYWCPLHENDLQSQIQGPGKWLSETDVDRL